MTVKRIIGGSKRSSFSIDIMGSDVNLKGKRTVRGIVDIDDSSMYNTLMGTPVLFTDVGEFDLDEELYEMVKPFCEDNHITPISKLPDNVRKKLGL